MPCTASLPVCRIYSAFCQNCLGHKRLECGFAEVGCLGFVVSRRAQGSCRPCRCASAAVPVHAWRESMRPAGPHRRDAPRSLRSPPHARIPAPGMHEVAGDFHRPQSSPLKARDCKEEKRVSSSSRWARCLAFCCSTESTIAAKRRWRSMEWIGDRHTPADRFSATNSLNVRTFDLLSEARHSFPSYGMQ